MYEIFANDKSIILTNVEENINNVKFFRLKDVTIDFIMSELNKKGVEKIYLYHPKEEKLLKKFKKKLSVIKAGGGVVTNKKGEILIMKRRGKWDLPKGKKEKGENIAVCALREVEEETGVKKLNLTRFRTITYHIFKQDGQYFLKETYWYDMETKYKGVLKAQIEEDIEMVCWKKPSEVKELIKKSYKNIQKIFE
ncbi:NUDIX hydrolase [Capnocytophaga cynodegmi]|uniref:NUDIX hydrolase domain protein n=1 Tax=Capnocytophaga cynodegmi TaxID=28189 RepID=A0A0B7HJW5_9FLAO|nr:NUDIX domain-containing protein [Capnocytophaga cynodegmi]CEN37818.1 NUDIX hydrolase domain protein [Capnocytophaga cynodegmi]